MAMTWGLAAKWQIALETLLTTLPNPKPGVHVDLMTTMQTLEPGLGFLELQQTCWVSDVNRGNPCRRQL
jgi:hypothetical protein